MKNVMLETHGMTIANQARVTPQQVEAVRSLLDAGATIPFIARYRKEKTGSLDEAVLSEIRDGLARLAAPRLDNPGQRLNTKDDVGLALIPY
jgi:transcriptional accessory protein Tex/SPT6